ncbi:Flavin-containing monooxygenase [Aphelenchoides bicaudatus]|nr:Flavin-containing monooxygenase [Aphelenchoides bicaudatus]
MANQRRVCIVGAGAAGLFAQATRHSLNAGYKVKVFEQGRDVGGTWIYSSELNVFSSLYENMVSNLPKEIMPFEDLKFEKPADKSFVGHQDVLAFLKEYGQPVRRLIKFGTRVNKIRNVDSKWQVTVKSDDSQKEETLNFDILFICNGHYSEPRVPECAKKLKIPWIHSHNYRHASDYKNKEVVIVGGNPSGFDIATQLSPYATKIHILHNQLFTFNLPDNIDYNFKLKDVDDDGQTLLLDNGEKLKAENVIFCSGYLHEIPFFEKSLIEPKADSSYLPVYQHFIHPDFPTSLFFIGLNWFVIPFTLFDLQMHYALALINGTAPVPSKEEMLQFEEDRLKSLNERNFPARYFHRLAENEQWEYFDLLAKRANRPNVPLVIRKIYENNIKNMIEDTANYKNNRYTIKSPEDFEVEPYFEK